MAEELAPYIYLPLPSMQDVPNRAAGRDEKLRTIIANLDKQHGMIRNNIIDAAISRQQQRTLAATDPAPDPNAMDVDTPQTAHPPLSSGGFTPINSKAPATAPKDSEAIDLLLHNLSVPFDESSGIDPCIPSDGKIPPPPDGMRQVTPPPNVQLARETMRQLQLYDGIAGEAREYYVAALRRGSLSGGTAASGLRMNTNVEKEGGYAGSGAGAVSAGRYVDRTSYNAYGTTTASSADHRVVASPVDPSRDPRLRGR